MANEPKTRVSDKQRKDNFYETKLSDILTDTEKYDAFWDKCKADGLEAPKVLEALAELYSSERIVLKKRKIVLEQIYMED